MNVNGVEDKPGNSATAADRTPSELRAEIENRKEAIAGTIKDLDEHVHRATDWRAQVGDHPYLAVGIAAGAGMFLAGRLRRRPGPGERVMDALAEGFEDLTDQVRDRIFSRFTRSLSGGVLKAAATALLTKAAAAYVREKATSEPNGHAVQDH